MKTTPEEIKQMPYWKAIQIDSRIDDNNLQVYIEKNEINSAANV
jgi:hypothetical protein